MVERTVAAFRRQLRFLEPARGELLAAIGHVFAAKHTKREHFCGRQFRLEFRIKVATDRIGQLVPIALLHTVIHGHPFFLAQARPFDSPFHEFSFQIAKLRTVAKQTHAARGTRHQPAILSIR